MSLSCKLSRVASFCVNLITSSCRKSNICCAGLIIFAWKWKKIILKIKKVYMYYSNITSFFRFVNKRTIYWLGIISLARVHVTDYPVVNVHVDELLSAQIWQQKLCATLSANVNINYRLPIKVYCRICTLRHIRIEIIHGSQNVFWVLTWVGVYPVIIVYTVYTGFWFIQCSVYTGFWFIQCSVYTGFWFIQCSV